MHGYSVDSFVRAKAFSILGVVAFVLSGAINGFSASYPVNFVVSFGLIFSALFLLFDRVLWKWGIPQLGVIPDLNGKWAGEGTSSFLDENNNPKKYKTEFTVKQTFSSIEIFSNTTQSTSKTVIAGLRMNSAQPELVYVFESTPKSVAPDDMKSHSGTQRLRLKDADTLEGDYFSGRDRGRTGTLILHRKKNGN